MTKSPYNAIAEPSSRTVTIRLDRQKALWLYNNHLHENENTSRCDICTEFDRVLFRDDFDADGLC
jgi:hypothetical protein